MTYDVAIVGAGPSGAWTATCLAKRGARVLLLDPSHPREKPCGGGITGRALKIVSPVVSIASLPHVTIDAARFLDAKGSGGASVSLDASGGALSVASRSTFDTLLVAGAADAGADVHALRVLDLVREGQSTQLKCAGGRTLRARFVVGADGANGLVRRRFARAFTRDQLSIATGFFAHGVTSREIVIELVTDPAGYIWSFPRPNHLAIGICAQADAGVSAATLRAVVREWINRTGIGADARLEPYSWPIPSLSAADVDRVPICGTGWLTVGDAAGLVDPITREGIFFALQSAEHAAAALSSPDTKLRYQERVRDDIGSELARAARLKAGFFRPQFTRLLVDALRSSEPVRKVMADLVAGTQPYRELKWRLLRTLEVRLAWRLLLGLAPIR